MDGPSSVLGPVEFVILWALKEVFTGGVFGLPPGERDPVLLRAAPADAVAYVEWAARSPGKEGAPGVDGFVSDPEIKALLAEVDKVISEIRGEEGNVDSDDPLSSRPVYEILKKMLTHAGGGYVRIDSEAIRKALDEGAGDGGVARGILGGTEAALLVNAGDQADAMTQELLSIVNAMAGEDEDATELDHHVIPTTTPHVKVFLHRHESYLIVALGPETLNRVLERMAGTRPGIAGNARFTASLQPLLAERTASLAWVDAQTAMASVKSGLGVKGLLLTAISGALGVDSIQSFTRVTSVTDGEVRTRSIVKTDGRASGLMALAGGRPLTAADFAHVPADSTLVAGASLNVEQVLASLKELAGKLDPEARKAIDEGLKQWEDETGFSISEATAAFGDVWTLHAAGSQGAALPPAVVLSLEVRDPARARSAVDKMQSILSQLIKGNEDEGETGMQFAEQDFLGRRIVWVESPGEGKSFTPSFCLTEKHLLFSLAPQPLKAYLRQAKAKRDGYDTRLNQGNALPSEGTLFVCRMESQPWVQSLAALLPYWGPEIASRLTFEGAEFDAFTLPSIEGLLPYASPFSSHVVRRKDGIEFEARGGLPVPGGLWLLLNLSYWLREPEFQSQLGAKRDAPDASRLRWSMLASSVTSSTGTRFLGMTNDLRLHGTI